MNLLFIQFLLIWVQRETDDIAEQQDMLYQLAKGQFTTIVDSNGLNIIGHSINNKQFQFAPMAGMAPSDIVGAATASLQYSLAGSFPSDQLAVTF